ncbi:MAG TPA: carboxypeptidase-like regulatory domain-containing protein [Elusimicrobiales bacterium]|nr:carboxypeptidase-like regulatory domain-containing protein [Elusimicrobiales bacterium]
MDSPAHDTTSFPGESIDYDTGYFPPEEIIEGGVVFFTRYTYVQAVREDSGVVGEIAANLPDTGMKRITVTVVWGAGAGGKRKVTLRSILANPGTIMSNVSFYGTVKSTDAVAIPGATVSLVEAAGCSDTTNASGEYNITGTPGSYTLMASAAGYYPAMRSVTVAAGGSLPNYINLTKIAVGNINGYPWIVDHLVISQVVGSTIDTSVTPNYDQEYVELFNPTTFTVLVNGDIAFKFRRADDASAKNIAVTYINNSIASGGYFLFANTGTVIVAGTDVDADAVWADANSTSDFPYFATQKNLIPVDEDGGGEGGGAIEMAQISKGRAIEKVGWNKTSHPAPFYEGQAIQQTVGLSRNELYARLTSTADYAGGVNGSFGPAYDTNYNSADFYDYTGGIPFAPHSTNSGVKTVISGTPAEGAVVTCTDGLSSSAEAALVLPNSPSHAQSYAYFSLVNVATGSWSVLITSGVYSLAQTTVTIAASGSAYIFPAAATFLTQTVTTGLVSGRVLNALGTPLQGIIVSPAGAPPTTTDANGRYRLVLDAGVTNITANPMPGGSSSYVTASSNTVPVPAGGVHSGVDFVLYQGGRVKGFVTRDGVNGLPNIAVAVLDYNGVARDQMVTGIDGRFTSVIISTGYYTVQLALDTLESSVPQVSTVSVAMGVTQFSSTFTVYGAMGSVTGSVTLGGQIIKSGVLVVVTTATLSGTPPVPPDLSSDTLTGTPFYLGSSMENGTYNIEVRAAPNYNVYGYYVVTGSTGSIIYPVSATGVTVVAGSATWRNFSW